MLATSSGARSGLGAPACPGWGGSAWRLRGSGLRAPPVAAPSSAEGAAAGCSSSSGAGGCSGAALRHLRRHQHQHEHQRVPRGVACAAYGRGRGSGGGGASNDPNYYELLGLEPNCDEEDIKAAFRRRAKELHPDVNKEDDATQSFVQLSRAYEVLSDPEARRQYDIDNSIRRFNFFRDIVEDDDDVRRSPFQWSQVSRRQGGGGGGGGNGLRPDDDSDDLDEDGEEDEQEEGEGDEDEQGPGWQRRRSPEEFLEDLARVMGGGAGSLRNFQSGRLDPWGTSTSDSWFRQVEKQSQSPYGPYRQGYGTSRDDDDGGAFGREWDPSRRTPGWTPPGRGSEWDHPRRQWDEEDRRGGGPGRQGGGGGGGGGGGDFRRPFKI
ncbi:hypothetical protein HYH02_013943 [Chlamydomonas schloesseri]|uniref:J domain-containing protein n=1 Tax=Chlamydomonas schloesseri TaxID=2026947 RepID=A0A835VVQ5_9CHLO|nr:hypothetical protein HYH02_013943 [Chlamydomonas schloesseri]|eukprot:KAG2429685.1 hypothetical protein HYH02_013943 [Chlamydomonas schloesseri]